MQYSLPKLPNKLRTILQSPRRMAVKRLAVAVALTSQGAWAVEPEEGREAALTKMPPIRVLGIAADTDGSNSYTSDAVTIAGKTPLKRRQIPQSVSVITRKQMDDQNLTTISDTLRQVPGVQVIANNSDQDQYHARGGALNVQYDGVPASSALSGYQQFDMAMYDRVEVMRGPTGLLDGSGGFSGTVNMVKKKPRADFSAGSVLSYGSWNNKLAQFDVTGALNQDKSLRGRMVASVQDRNYYFDRAHDHRWLGYGVMEYDIAPNSTLSVALASQEDYNPGFSGLGNYTNGQFLNVPRSTNPNPSWQRYYWATTEYSVGLDHRFDNGWVAKFKANRRAQTFRFTDAYPTVGVTPGTNNIASYGVRDSIYHYTRDGVDASLSGSFDLLGRSHMALIGYNYDWFVTQSMGHPTAIATNVNLFNPDVIKPLTTPFTTGTESLVTQQGLYGNVRFKLADPLTLVMGGRFTDFNSKNHNVPPAATTPWVQGAKANNEFTPYGGLVYDVTSKLSVYGSYADIFVPQTQLMFGGGTLPPRVGKQYEIGAKGEYFDGKLNASAAIFNIQDTNRSFADPVNIGFFVPLGRAESRGLELEVSGSPLKGLALNGGYTRNTTTQLVAAPASLGLPLSQWYPTHTYKIWSNYQVQGGALADFNFGLGMNGHSRNWSSSAPTLRSQGGFAVWTAQLGYKFSKSVSANFTVENLFDKVYYTRLQGNNTYNYFGTPRNFMLTLRADM